MQNNQDFPFYEKKDMANFGIILMKMKQKGLLDKFNIWGIDKKTHQKEAYDGAEYTDQEE